MEDPLTNTLVDMQDIQSKVETFKLKLEHIYPQFATFDAEQFLVRAGIILELCMGQTSSGTRTRPEGLKECRVGEGQWG